MYLATVEELNAKTREMKLATLKMCEKTGIGYPSSSFSCAEILIALYYHVMELHPEDPNWRERDRFVFSKGHASSILYPILKDIGFFGQEVLDGYMQLGGQIGLMLKPTIPGVECVGGTLGIGFGVACGMALGLKMDRIDRYVFTIIGDGESSEGSIWEAAMFAGKNRLNNLIAFTDRNYLCKTDFTENLIQLEPLEDKWAAFGWDVKRIDGHNMASILSVLKDIRSFRRDKPLMIIAETVKGNGIDYMCNDPLWHGTMPKEGLLQKAYEELNQ
ncbi:transketolase [Oscillibacter sp.]|uniref:transketolase n=1 Tax=Oscillibacter sp. TaxID=1945593 RepID=UPI0028A7F03A|nr:transketolase [Oscillibacter sp.]